MPSTNVSGSGLPAANALTSSAVYTQEWVNEVHFRRVNVSGPAAGAQVRVHSDSQLAIRGSASPASGGHSSISRGHHANSSCSWSGADGLLGALGEPGLADEHDEPVRQPQQRLAAHALGRDSPLLPQLPDQRVGGVLSEVHRAARPERPASGPRGDPRGPPPGQPAAVGRAGHAQRGHALRRRRRRPVAAPSAAAAARARVPPRPGGSRPGARPSRRGWAILVPAAP